MKRIRTEPHNHGAEGDERIRTAVCEPSTDSVYVYRAVLEDIAKGRWNTGARVLDTRDTLTAIEYAQAALRGVPVYRPAARGGAR